MIRTMLTAAVVLLAACSSGADSTDNAQPEDELTHLTRHAHAMLAAIRDRDFDRVASFYDTDGSFVHFENGAQSSWPVLASQIRQFFDAAATIQLHWVGEPHIELLGPDAALVRGVHSFEGTLRDGTVMPSHTGVWSGILRRIDGQWKLIHSHSSEHHGDAQPAGRS
jgi:uncharacterized protein (TIGR02246 family)